MNIEGRGVYKVTTMCVHWLSLSVIQILCGYIPVLSKNKVVLIYPNPTEVFYGWNFFASYQTIVFTLYGSLKHVAQVWKKLLYNANSKKIANFSTNFLFFAIFGYFMHTKSCPIFIVY